MIWNEGLITFGYDEIEAGDEVVIAGRDILHINAPDGNTYYQPGMDHFCGMNAIVTGKGRDHNYGGFYLRLDKSPNDNYAWSPWMVEKLDTDTQQPLNADISMLFSEEDGLNVEY